MSPKVFMVIVAVVAGLIFFGRAGVEAGVVPQASGYKVLAPIRQGNLTVFPVVAAVSHDTHDFLTLDEGVRSGEVVVSESGSIQPLRRRQADQLARQRRAPPQVDV